MNPFLGIRIWPPVTVAPEQDCVPIITHTRELLEKEGLALLEQDPVGAMACFDSALVLDPNDSALLKRRVTALSKMGKYEQAIHALDDILNNNTRKSNEEMGSLHSSKGNAYYCMGALDQALDSYQTALGLEPRLVNTWYMQGVVWFNKKDYEKALGSFEKARELKAQMITSFYIGNCYVHLKRFPDAERTFEGLIFEGFTDATVYFTLGVTKRNLGKWMEARPAWKNSWK